MSVRFLHCNVTIFPFVKKNTFWGDTLRLHRILFFIKLSSSNIRIHWWFLPKIIITMVVAKWWFFHIFKNAMVSLPQGLCMCMSSTWNTFPFLFNRLTLIISLDLRSNVIFSEMLSLVIPLDHIRFLIFAFLWHHILLCRTYNFNLFVWLFNCLSPLLGCKHNECLFSYITVLPMPSTVPGIHRLFIKFNWLKEWMNGSHGVLVRISQNKIPKIPNM